MVQRRDRFSGNVLLYDYLSAKRAPVFLNRNFTRALRIHHQLSEGIASPGDAGDRGDSRSEWKPPDHDNLDFMMELAKSKGCFIFDVFRIVPLHRDAKASASEQVEPISKSRVLFRTKCRLLVSIDSPLPGLQGKEIAAQPATLQKISSSRNNDRAVNIETERITVFPEGFSSPTDDKHKIRVTFVLTTQSDAEELFNYLDLGPNPKKKVSTELAAVWDNILKCPDNKAILPFVHWGGKLNFGLEVSMRWVSLAGNSILAIHNGLSRRRFRSETSTKSLHPNITYPPARVTFHYDHKTLVKDGFTCPHEGKKFEHINQLRMHFEGTHGNVFCKVSSQGVDEDGIEYWTFICEVSDLNYIRGAQRPSARADEPFDNGFIAPDIPFNQRQFLEEGIDDFHRLGRTYKSYTESRAAGSRLTSTRGAQGQRLSRDVPERLPREKKKYPVPPAPPGITFFRSCSKRPLTTGECISESDDEADNTWIKSRKSAEFNKKANIPTAIKAFLTVFDAHMRSEQLNSDLHVGDALVRFAREKREWILEEDAKDVFHKKLDELLEDKIITEEIHAGCLKIVDSAGSETLDRSQEISDRLAQLEMRQTSHDGLYDDPPPLRASRRRPDKGKGKAKVTETGHLTPITADSDGDLEMREVTLSTAAASRSTIKVTTPPKPYDLCLCGEDAQASSRKSPLIACTSMNCVRRTFHYDCIKERWKIKEDLRALRKLAWICEDCKPQSATGN